LCLDLGIDHRLITPGHPEANGLAERIIVQVLKNALRKYVLIHGVVAWPFTLLVVDAQESTFQKIKEMLISAPVLRNPNWKKPFILHILWSKAGVGAYLSQIADDGQEYAIAYASRMNSRVESAFSSYEGEVSAVVYAVHEFRYYLWGQHFELITDCKAMEWLTTPAKLRSKLSRWSLLLAEYDFTITHRPGKDSTVPDLLSRKLVTGTTFYGRGVGTSFHLVRCATVPSVVMAYLSRQWAVPIAAGYAAGCFTTVNVRRRVDPWEDAETQAFIRGRLVQTDVRKERWA